MKKVGVVAFVILAILICYYINNSNEKAFLNNTFNIKSYELMEECDDVFVGNYTVKNLSNFNNLSKNNYVSFEINKEYLHQLFDTLHIQIVKKYKVFDKKVYDCHSDMININRKINIQIAVGEKVKIGIPTIFEGF